MKAIHHTPIRKEEFTKDQWFDIARNHEPGLTRGEFNRKWPQFCKFLEMIQNAQIVEFKTND